jgi:hypothetical protein
MSKTVAVQDKYRLQQDRRNNPLLTWVFEHVEEQETPVRRISYQPLLRALGAWLDTNNACNVNLIETSTGFIIRYGVGEEPLLLNKYILTYAELEHLEAAMRERRSINPSGRHQDFLRALGYEIDEQAGQYIVLDQIEDSLFLTFCHQSVGGGLTWVKRARVLGPADQAAVLRRAYARRKPPEVRRRIWRRIWRRQGSPVRVTRAA